LHELHGNARFIAAKGKDFRQNSGLTRFFCSAACDSLRRFVAVE
jgi:hypothetical protein